MQSVRKCPFSRNSRPFAKLSATLNDYRQASFLITLFTITVLTTTVLTTRNRWATWAPGTPSEDFTMKRSVILPGIGLLLGMFSLTPALAQEFRPEPGVRCDRDARVCYYRGELSTRYTREYFGGRSDRDDRFARLGSRWEGRDSGGDTFYPERGVRCDRLAQVCSNRRGEPSVRLTREYLGFRAARRLERRMDRDY